MKKILCVVAVVTVGVCGMCNGMHPTASSNINARDTVETAPLYLTEARKIANSFDINTVAIDSEEMCVLEQNIACGWIDGIDGTTNFREKLAELSLEKLDFAKEDSIMKAALICFALQSTSHLSEKLWEKYNIENLLFKKGRFDAEDKCMDMYRITKERAFALIPAYIWMFMYSKHLVTERIPEQ
ncbi:MAG: hypothetical protein LBP41_01545 [Holosporaceae bacterium]|jgi:uncharacterized membrane protein YjgN (DUF898 family)|nr:hypothetical protein [Holosporaceae bacterium]